MPAAGRARLRTPGIQAVTEHHRDQMHSRLTQLCRQRLAFRLRIPEGTKLRRTDTSSVGRYKGSPRFQELEHWLTKFAVMLQAMQYGGDDCDLERVLAIPEFLEGEAERWFCRHIVHVNRSQEHWTFEQVIMGLYDRFIHLTTMQEARDMYYTAQYNPQ